jgi:predicted kinase
MNKLAQEHLRNGSSVICDANVEFIRDREAIYKFVSKLGAKSSLVWIKTPLDISLHRNGPNDDQFVQDYTQMVAEYEKRLQIPLENEPIILINGDVDFEQQYTQLMDNT